METLSSDSGPRTAFAERLSLLYKEAGNPPLKRVAEAVAQLQRVDERGRPVRVSVQRISDWRRARNVPAQFAALAAVLSVLVPQARRDRPVPVSPGLYDMVQWQRLWERAVADPVGDRLTGSLDEEEPPAAEVTAVPGGVCPYRGLAAYRLEDTRWFFGRERSTDALVAQLRAAETTEARETAETADTAPNSDTGTVTATGGPIMLVGASGAGKSSLLSAGLVPALQEGALGGPGQPAREVLQLVPGSDPLAELTRRIPGLSEILSPDGEPAIEPGTPEFAHAVRETVTAWARRDAPDSSTAAPARPVVIVDQFEETFTLCLDETVRNTFIQVLHAASSPPGPGERAGHCEGGARARRPRHPRRLLRPVPAPSRTRRRAPAPAHGPRTADHRRAARGRERPRQGRRPGARTGTRGADRARGEHRRTTRWGYLPCLSGHGGARRGRPAAPLARPARHLAAPQGGPPDAVRLPRGRRYPGSGRGDRRTRLDQPRPGGPHRREAAAAAAGTAGRGHPGHPQTRYATAAGSRVDRTRPRRRSPSKRWCGPDW